MSWTLWTRTGKPAPPVPSRPPGATGDRQPCSRVRLFQPGRPLSDWADRISSGAPLRPGHRLAWLPTRGGGPRLCHDQGPPSRGPEASQAGRRNVREVRACPHRCRLGHSMLGTAEGTAGVGRPRSVRLAPTQLRPPRPESAGLSRGRVRCLPWNKAELWRRTRRFAGRSCKVPA